MTITIPLTRGYVTIIDDRDADLTKKKWCARMAGPANSYAYGYRQASSKPFRGEHLHRVVLERMIGRPMVKGEVVDHIDGNPLNNCRANLRLATQQQNACNRYAQKNNTTGFKGVVFNSIYNKWVAQIKSNGKLLNLGTFDTPESAHARYCEEAIRLHGRFANDGVRPLRLADAPVATRQLPLFGFDGEAA